MNVAPLSTGQIFDSTPGEEMDDDELLEDGSFDEVSDEDPDDEMDRPFRIPVMDPSVSDTSCKTFPFKKTSNF